MVDAAMRDSTRRLNEQTLPGIGLAASGTGNANNTRRFMNEAIAQSSYDDRRADVRANIGRDLVNQYLRSDQTDFNNMVRANQGLRDVFGVRHYISAKAAQMLSLEVAACCRQMNKASSMPTRDLFERQRDFAMGQYGISAICSAKRQMSAKSVQHSQPVHCSVVGCDDGCRFRRQHHGLLQPNQS